MIMSWVGRVTGRPSDGFRMLFAGEHQDAGLGLRLDRQRQVDGHLVAVEVRVERGADERVQLDGLALDELRLEGLDAETVQRGRAVQQNGALADDLLEHVPDLRTRTLDHALGALDVLRVAQVDQALDHERLEQLERHLLGQTALVQLELRSDDDDRTARVVDALAEQVLAEPALLALEHVAQRLQRAVAGTRDGAAAAAVVEQGVDGLLQHPLLVVDDDLGSPEVEQTTQTVVAVDHAAVQVVQVGGREAATVELDHRAKLRRDHRHDVEHHRGRRVAGLQEGVDDAQTLDRTDLLLALAGGDLLVEQLALGGQVEGLEALLDALGTHVGLEVQAVAVLQLVEHRVFGLQVADLERAEVFPHALELGDLLVEATCGPDPSPSRRRP